MILFTQGEFRYVFEAGSREGRSGRGYKERQSHALTNRATRGRQIGRGRDHRDNILCQHGTGRCQRMPVDDKRRRGESGERYILTSNSRPVVAIASGMGKDLMLCMEDIRVEYVIRHS